MIQEPNTVSRASKTDNHCLNHIALIVWEKAELYVYVIFSLQLKVTRY